MCRNVTCALALLLVGRTALAQVETVAFQIPAGAPDGLVSLLLSLPSEAVQKVDLDLRQITLRELAPDNERLSTNQMRFVARTLRILGKSRRAANGWRVVQGGTTASYCGDKEIKVHQDLPRLGTFLIRQFDGSLPKLPVKTGIFLRPDSMTQVTWGQGRGKIGELRAMLRGVPGLRRR
jgi:hypothetical protein